MRKCDTPTDSSTTNDITTATAASTAATVNDNWHQPTGATVEISGAGGTSAATAAAAAAGRQRLVVWGGGSSRVDHRVFVCFILQMVIVAKVTQ